MAGQTLEYQIKGTSDVEATTGRAMRSIGNMEKQIEGINRKFSAFGKDLFLSFAAPMVLVNSLISFISDSLSKAKQDSLDALKFVEQGQSRFVTSEASTVAKVNQIRKDTEKEKVQAERGSREAYADLLLNTDEGRKIFEKNRQIGQGFRSYQEGDIVKSNEQIAAEEMAKNPAVKAQLDALAKKQLEESGAVVKTQMPEGFKGPEGFSNVVGVGANPALEAMSKQLEAQLEGNRALEMIAGLLAGQTPPLKEDFTKTGLGEAINVPAPTFKATPYGL